MIKLHQVSFQYTEQENILNNASLTFNPNKITVVLGRNGIGKTTLLSLVDGFLTANTGTIEVSENPLFIYDQPYLYEYLTGAEYLELIKDIHTEPITVDIDKLIKDLELSDAMNKLIANYSLGMKHKLALLSGLILDYNLYLIDEPLTALDPDSQAFMIDLFKDLRRSGKTFVISTHMLNVAYELADEIVIFRNRKLEKHENKFTSLKAFEEFVIHSLRAEVTKDSE